MKLSAPKIDFHDDPLNARASDDVGGSIDAWLGVVSRLMRLPEATRTEIRNELREHLRERVRDLMLSGGNRVAERDAVRMAIEELGETAQLARRFEAANQPRSRRFAMHALMTIVGAGAVAAGVMTFLPRANDALIPMARFEAASASPGDAPAALKDGRFSIAATAALRETLEKIVNESKLGLMADWSALADHGVEIDEPMGLSFHEMSGERALSLIAEMVSDESNRMDWRMRPDNVIEFGFMHDLDRREVELVTYDISAALELIAAASDDQPENVASDVMELVTMMVEPENWIDNGGDLAQMKLVGGRLFVQAPTRMQGKVKWILEQLPNGPVPQSNATPDQPAPVRRVLNPGDTVTVSVFELYQPNTWATATRQIDEVGMFRVSEIGDVRAAGRTIEQFKNEVARQLQTKVMPIKPTVEVGLETGLVSRQ